MADEKMTTTKANKGIEIRGTIVAGGHREGESKTGNKYSMYGIQVSCGLARVLDVTLNSPRIGDLDDAIENEQTVTIQVGELRARDFSVAVSAKSITLPSGKAVVAVE